MDISEAKQKAKQLLDEEMKEKGEVYSDWLQREIYTNKINWLLGDDYQKEQSAAKAQTARNEYEAYKKMPDWAKDKFLKYKTLNQNAGDILNSNSYIDGLIDESNPVKPETAKEILDDSTKQLNKLYGYVSEIDKMNSEISGNGDKLSEIYGRMLDNDNSYLSENYLSFANQIKENHKKQYESGLSSHSTPTSQDVNMAVEAVDFTEIPVTEPEIQSETQPETQPESEIMTHEEWYRRKTEAPPKTPTAYNVISQYKVEQTPGHPVWYEYYLEQRNNALAKANESNNVAEIEKQSGLLDELEASLQEINILNKELPWDKDGDKLSALKDEYANAEKSYNQAVNEGNSDRATELSFIMDDINNRANELRQQHKTNYDKYNNMPIQEKNQMNSDLIREIMKYPVKAGRSFLDNIPDGFSYSKSNSRYQGEQLDDLMMIQQFLRDNMGMEFKNNEFGYYGDKTTAKIKEFQKEFNKNNNTALNEDGVLDSKTYAAMGFAVDTSGIPVRDDEAYVHILNKAETANKSANVTTETTYDEEEILKDIEIYSSLNVPIGSTSERYDYIFGSGKKQYSSQSEALANMTEVSVPVWKIDKNGNKYSSTAYIQVNKKLADVVVSIFTEIYNHPEKAAIKNAGGFRWPDSYVNHPSGTAIDINWEENPMTDNKGNISVGKLYQPDKNQYSLSPDSSVVKTFKKYGWDWGGDWKSKKDYMHFSYLGG